MPPEPPTDIPKERRVLEEQCPNLRAAQYEVKSCSTAAYNCLAWAVGDCTHNWSHKKLGGYYWPPDLPRDDSVETIMELFRRRGFRECKDVGPEAGVEKIAIYGDRLGCLHVARQTGGPWMSKMGDLADIEHTDVEAAESGMTGGFITVMCTEPEERKARPSFEVIRRLPRRLSDLIQRATPVTHGRDVAPSDASIS
jgi:hypothetical protein